MDCKKPPSLVSTVLVTMFTVPPTDEMANLEDPNPLCTWTALATSVTPCQLDQYILPSSIPLMGCPLIRKAVLDWSKPRTWILESPNPPPLLEVYTEGVDFNNSGNSKFPPLSAISAALMV